MPLNNYTLRSPSVVILADQRDPYVSWQHHLERTGGLRGGVDIVAKVGTPVYARTDGVMLHVPNDGSAGNSCRFEHTNNPGWRDVFSHLSRYVGVSGQHFKAGDIVAYTGNTGNVTEHLHWHLVDPSGVRRNPWDYFSGSILAGDTGTIIDETPTGNENTMLMIHRTDARTDGQYLFAIFGPNFWLEFVGSEAANAFIRQITPVGSSLAVTASFWNTCKASAKPAV